MESLFSKSNWIRAVSVATLVALGYFLPNHFIFLPTHSVLLTAVDRWVPLDPSWIWFYVSYYVLLALAYFVNTGRRAQRFYIETILLAAFVGFVIFVFFPTSIPRGLYPWTGPSSWSSDLLEHIRRADNSVNCLPSMHICMGLIAASAMGLAFGRWVRIVIWLWFLGISYSTLATKQHYFVDVVSGFMLGLVCLGIFLKRHDLVSEFADVYKQKPPPSGSRGEA